MAKAYEGVQPYIFISYSHKDSEQVLAIVEDLQLRGYRVWFDGGIEAGSEWPEYIASHLRNCQCVIAFISQNYVNSSNCRRELVFAQNLEIPQLNVYLSGSVQLSDGLQMQLGLNQSLWRNRFRSEKEFYDALAEAKMLELCREINPYRQEFLAPEPEPAPQPEPEQRPEVTKPAEPDYFPPTEEEEHFIDMKRVKRASRRAAIPELLHIPLSFFAMQQLTLWTDNGWILFFGMIVPHVLMSIFTRSVFRKNTRDMTKHEKAKANSLPFGLWMLGCLAALLVCIPAIQLDHNFFMRLLMALGLNIAPTIISGLIVADIL